VQAPASGAAWQQPVTQVAITVERAGVLAWVVTALPDWASLLLVLAKLGLVLRQGMSLLCTPFLGRAYQESQQLLVLCSKPPTEGTSRL